MARDVAEAIYVLASDMDKQEKAEDRRRFFDKILDNHYNVCIEKISLSGHPENGTVVHHHHHHGSCSFYIADGHLYSTVGNDVFKPERLINVTENKDAVFGSLVHHFHNYFWPKELETVCWRMVLSVPKYVKNKKNGKRGAFKFWETIARHDYSMDTSIDTILDDAIRFLSCIRKIEVENESI